MAGLQTGHGTTLVFGTTAAFLPGYTAIGGPGWTRDSHDTTVLTTAGARTSIGGDIWGISPIVSNYLVDASTLATGEANSIDDLLFNKSTTSTGTAQGGSTSTTIVLAAIETYTDDELVSAKVTLTGGTGAGQSRTITANVGSTDTATVVPPWVVTPVGGSTTYSIVKDPMTVDETITITLDGGASFSGSGHVTALEMEDLTTDQLVAASVSVQFADSPTIGDGS